MNALNICFFCLLVLGALTQAKEENLSSKLDKTIEDTADLIANYVGSFIQSKKVTLLKKFDNEVKTLKGQPDKCAFHKVNRIANLRSEYQGNDGCTFVDDLIGSVRSIIVNGTHIAVNLIGNTADLVTGTVACVMEAKSDPVDCTLNQVKTLVGQVVSTVPEIVGFVISTVQNVGSLVSSLLNCLHLQKHTEQRFNEIMSSQCP